MLLTKQITQQINTILKDMENDNLLEKVRSKAQGWLTESYDAETRAQVQAPLDNDDPTELIESFYNDL